jgi:fatty-acyl-CoA synthase
MAQLSYVHGASGTPLIGETIGAHFDKVAERCGERAA